MDQILHILNGIREIVLNRENLENDFKNIKYNNFLNDAMLETRLKAYIIVEKIQADIEKYIEKKQKLLFLKDEAKKVKKLDFINIEYRQLGGYVNKPEVCENLVQKVLEYRQIEKNIHETQQSINELIRMREQLIKISDDETILGEGICPICTNLLVKNRELCHNKIQGVIYYGHKYRRINKTFTRRIPAGML